MRRFYKNTVEGLCQQIVLRQLSESTNLSFDKFVKIIDPIINPFLKMSMTSLIARMSEKDWYNRDVYGFLKAQWESREFTTLTVEDKILISVFLQHICMAITGIDIFWLKGEQPIPFSRAHMENVNKYINVMKNYTDSVPIVCYRLWLTDGLIEEVGHVYVIFKDMKTGQLFNYDSNRNHPFLVHYPRVVEYVVNEGIANYHGSKMYIMDILFGGCKDHIWSYITVIILIAILICILRIENSS